MFDFLLTRRGFRIAWLSCCSLAIVSGFIDSLLPFNSHPDIKANLMAAQELNASKNSDIQTIVAAALSIIFVLATIKSVVGVYQFKKKDLNLSIYITFAALPLYYFFGDVVYSYMSFYLSTLSFGMYGFCLAAAYVSPLNGEFK
jgi:hypothetical protein